MFKRTRELLTFANVCSFLALAVAISTGGAYAANTVFSTDIVNGEVKTPDLAASAVTSPKILDGGVKVVDLNDGAVTGDKLSDGGVQTADLADGGVTGPKIADSAVTNAKIGDGAVTSTKIGDGAVTNFKLASGVVTHSKLGPDSIDGSNVAANSLTLSDILGANVNGSIGFSLSANHCGNLNLGVSGAQVGQVVLFSFTGSTAVPAEVVFGGVKVTAANTVVVRACNVGASAMSVSNLGIHVVTFG